jgi:hypothetical protein
MKQLTEDIGMMEGLISSINASYTREELRDMLIDANFRKFQIAARPAGLIVKGVKVFTE